MSVGDMPTIGTSTYTSNTFGLARAHGAVGNAQLGGAAGGAVGQLRHISAGGLQQLVALNAVIDQHKQEITMIARRLVQVFIADPDDNVPLEQSMLYSGEQKLTDATDQELYFEIDIKTLLDAHNAERVKLINKKVKERTEYLEPAKIRDLKMVVVEIARF